MSQPATYAQIMAAAGVDVMGCPKMPPEDTRPTGCHHIEGVGKARVLWTVYGPHPGPHYVAGPGRGGR